jgi:hypothetical protein
VTSRRILLATVAATLALAPHAALAQQRSTVRITDRIARNHFENGNEYFRLGRYADAAREFEHAFEISHQNELLYNVAWSYELAGDLTNALGWYERFQQAGAPGIGTDVLQQRMDALRSRIAASPSSTAPPSTTNGESPAPTNAQPVTQTTTAGPTAPHQPPEVRYEYHQSTLNTVGPFVLMGVGAVFAGLTVWQGVAFGSDSSAVAAANNGTRPWSNMLGAQYSHVATEGTLTWVFGGVAVAAIASGVIWLVARGPGERIEVRASRTNVFAAPVAQGAVVGLGGVF